MLSKVPSEILQGMQWVHRKLNKTHPIREVARNHRTDEARFSYLLCRDTSPLSDRPRVFASAAQNQ